MWEISHFRSFYKDLVKLSPDARKTVEDIAFGKDIREIPFQLGIIEKLTGHKEFYKIRIGGLKIDKTKKIL